jgi:hypothetical protein
VRITACTQQVYAWGCYGREYSRRSSEENLTTDGGRKMCTVTAGLAGQIYRLRGSVGCTKLTDLKYIIQQKLREKVFQFVMCYGTNSFYMNFIP